MRMNYIRLKNFFVQLSVHGGLYVCIILRHVTEKRENIFIAIIKNERII